MVAKMSGYHGRSETHGYRDATTPRSPRPLAPAVLEGVRHRDAGALAAFFDRYFDCIYGLTYHLLGNRSLAEDATRETLRRILRQACGLGPKRDALFWVVSLTLHTCELFQMRSTHGREGDSTEYREEIRAAIDDLSESLRTVVILRDFQGLGQDEIAELTGSTREDVRRRYLTALSALSQVHDPPD